MKYLLAFVLLTCSSTLSQVTVVNPKHLEFPNDKVNIIFRTACKVVAEEFHERTKQCEFPLTLVLGAPDDGYTEDEGHPLYTIHLDRWNEVIFTMAAVGVAIQHMVPQQRREKMAREVLRRSEQVAPVPITAFTREHNY
jgi:hypothetical protein